MGNDSHGACVREMILAPADVERLPRIGGRCPPYRGLPAGADQASLPAGENYVGHYFLFVEGAGRVCVPFGSERQVQELVWGDHDCAGVDDAVDDDGHGWRSSVGLLEERLAQVDPP